MTTNRILIVDDEETLCEVLKLNLENEGYEVVYLPVDREGCVSAGDIEKSKIRGPMAADSATRKEERKK